MSAATDAQALRELTAKVLMALKKLNIGLLGKGN